MWFASKRSAGPNKNTNRPISCNPILTRATFLAVAAFAGLLLFAASTSSASRVCTRHLAYATNKIKPTEYESIQRARRRVRETWKMNPQKTNRPLPKNSNSGISCCVVVFRAKFFTVGALARPLLPAASPLKGRIYHTLRYALRHPSSITIDERAPKEFAALRPTC